MALINNNILKKTRLGERPGRAWFSHLLWHPARNWSGSILTIPEPACSRYPTVFQKTFGEQWHKWHYALLVVQASNDDAQWWQRNTHQVPLVIEIRITELQVIHVRDRVLCGKTLTISMISLIDGFVVKMSNRQFNLFVMYYFSLVTTQQSLLFSM